MSAAVAAASTAAISSSRRTRTTTTTTISSNSYTQNQYPSLRRQQQPVASMNRYESMKRRDWNTFMEYLRKHQLNLCQCSGSDVVQFIKYLDQGWGSLDGMIGRLRVSFVENGGKPGSNPFGSKVVSVYLSEVKDAQDKARGRG